MTKLSQPQHQRAWERGAEGEERVAARLAKLLHGYGVDLLHDRRIPGTRANIDHLAIGQGGVTVIDAKHYEGQVRSEARGGLLRPRTQHLLIGGRDQTRLVEGVKRQAALVLTALQHAGEDVGVRAALCMADAGGLPMLGHPSVDGIAVDGARHIAKIARRPGSLSDHDVARITASLAQSFPVA